MTDNYYRLPERRTAHLTARVPKSVIDGLKEIARLWEIAEKLKDPIAEVSQSDVVVRLLEVGIAGAWAQMEIDHPPRTEKEWEDIKRRVTKLMSEKQ